MALTVATTTQYGLNVNNAYCRIEGISISKDGTMAFTLVRYVAQGTPYPSFSQTQYSAQYDMQGANVYKQAYAYLKTLDEFKSAIDVYEAGQPAK
jgi:hypothetical protein